MSQRRAIMTLAQIRRFVQAARAEDPRAIVEIVTDAGTVRILPEGDKPAESPFDAWKARREGQAARN